MTQTPIYYLIILPPEIFEFSFDLFITHNLGYNTFYMVYVYVLSDNFVHKNEYVNS